MFKDSKVDNWLGSLNKNLTLNGNGLCTFDYQGTNCQIELSDNLAFLYFTSPIRGNVDLSDAALLAWILNKNYTQEYLSGANYALDAENATLLLYYTHVIRATDDQALYNNMLSNFLNIVKKCSEDVDDNAPNSNTNKQAELHHLSDETQIKEFV